MDKEQAVVYLRFSGFSDEQIKAIEGAFTCDKCVYSTSEGCQYDDITETIPPFETSEDAISRQKMLEGLANIAKAKARSDAQKALMGRIMFFTEQLPPVNPQEPICPSAGVDCEDCPAYEKKPNINDVLDKIRAEIDEQYDRVHPYNISCAEGLEMALNIVDKYIAEEDKA